MTPRSFITTSNRLPRAAIFVSGTGTNAERVVARWRDRHAAARSWEPAAIVTDAPGKSRAGVIASAEGLPLVSLDIRAFYQERGEGKVSLATERGRQIRAAWTDSLRKLIAPLRIDFGILAGFVPLTNLTADFPCLNVHPGDLTVEEGGRRLLVGLHTLPIETAILRGLPHLRSSVIVAQPYTGGGGEMDSGPILGISPPVAIDLQGNRLDILRRIADARPRQRPVGGYKDLLEGVAAHNQDLLKRGGDWIVFPRVVEDFAEGNFALDDTGGLFFRTEGVWRGVKTVAYDVDSGINPVPV